MKKVTEVTYGTIDGEQSRDDRYLLPLSAVEFENSVNL